MESNIEKLFSRCLIKSLPLATLPMTAKNGLLKVTIVQYLSQNNLSTIQRVTTMFMRYDFTYIFAKY